jgi:hypothetical protein
VIVWNDFGLDYSSNNPTVRADVQRLTETAFCSAAGAIGTLQ